jgi:DUF1707 SHOCT-like domain
MATGPDLRIGDADREAAAASLREHYAQGRLTLEEFNQRLDAVFAATTQSQLNQITRDLPHSRMPSAPLPVSSVVPGGDQRERRHGGRPRLGLLPLIIAVLGTWFVLIALHMQTFFLPGKVAIFLAVLTLARGLLRRVFGLGRGYGGGCGRRRF